MKILHISDLHYTNSQEVLEKIQNQINFNIDICLFTGDLVDKFSSPLNKAYNVLKEFNRQISCDNFYITCGNHDIDRDLIKGTFIKTALDFKYDEDINSFVRENKANDYTDNLKHLNDYQDLLKSEYATSEHGELYCIHNCKIDSKNVTIVDLNFSWCAFNDINKDKIVFPSSVVRQIVKKLNKDNFNILMTHFPLFFLNDNCNKYISDLIYKHFDCHFTGHSHEHDLTNYNYSENGLFTCVASSIIDRNNPNNIGYCVFDFNAEDYTINCSNSIYYRDKFIQEEPVKHSVPTNDEKKNEIKLFEGIKNKLMAVIEKVNLLFVPTFDKNTITFKELYTKPNLKNRGFNKQYSIDSSDKVSNKSSNIDVDVFYKENNYLIYGKEKCGKTVLLYELIITLLEKFSQFRSIPIYIDMKDVYTKSNYIFDLTNEIQQQYSFSTSFIKSVISSYKVKILIDNFNIGYKHINVKLFEFLKKTENCSYLITTTYVFDALPFNLDDLEYSTLYIHDISRSSMRELTNKWPSEKSLDKNDVFKKMVSIFSQLNIHFNYWTVSLFLCVFDKTDNLKLHNNSELIDLYVESLLDKQKLSLTSTKTFSYDNLRLFLASLAHFLYKEKSHFNYSAKYAEIVNCYEKYKENNPRVVTEVKIIIDYILQKGIIFKSSEDTYTFRLNGVFEYFLAYHMYKNSDFKYEIINNSETYLKFKNELEIYSGLQKDDFEFLLQIYYNTEDALKLLKKKIPSEIDYEKKIEEENEDIKNLFEFASDIKNEIEPISFESQDLINDELQPISDIDSNIQVKKEYSIKEIDANLYAEHLNILGRVIRNLDEIKGDDKDLLKIIFRFLIDQSCLTIYYSIQEFTEKITKDKIDHKKLKEFWKLMSTFSPLLTQAFLFENVSHPTLSQIIEDEIIVLMAEPVKNQFKLYVLYFLLIESNIDIMHPKIKDIITVSKNWNVRQSIFFKLIMLIAFKCDKNPPLHKALKNHLEEIHKILYPGRDNKNQPQSNKGIINKILKGIEKNNENE